MKILAIMLSLPVPATAGHRLRNRSLLRALALEGHETVIASYASAEEIANPARELRNLCSEFHLLANPENRLKDRAWAAFGAMPYGALRLTTPAMQAKVAELLSAHNVDAILCDDIYMAGNIPASNRVPVLLNKHDITCRIVRQFAAAEANPLKKLYAWLEAHKVERLEAAVCNCSHAVAVCSTRDMELLREIAPAARMFVIPNVIDVEKYSYRLDIEPNTVLFVGAMDWLPNQNGAEFLVYDILPRLRRLVPTVKVVIAGRNPSEAMLRRYARFPDVVFTGTVVDLRPVLARAAVCVVPLRVGSGTRLKILEAAAMSKAIVSTTLGAEGLDELRHGEQILLEDEPRRFAEAVALLLTQPERARELGEAARRAAEEQYSIPALRKQLRTFLALPESDKVAVTGGAPR